MGENKKSKIVGFVICGVQLLVSVIFVLAVVQLNVLPGQYVLIGVVILVLLLLGSFLAQFKSRKRAIIAKIISGLITIILIVGTVYAFKAYEALTNISTSVNQLENMVMAVPVNDEAEDIYDVANYIIAVEGDSDTEELDGLNGYVAIIIEEIETILGDSVQTMEYASLSEQITALNSGEVDAIVYNAAYMDIIGDEDPDFVESIKVIFEHGIEVEKEEEEEIVDIEDEVFTVYISGIDTYGNIANTSRSDVNIIAVVNQTTEQILLVSTPRDYYVELVGVSGESEDKLTHAGIYGVDVSIATLEQLYQTEIDFYARVNFTSVINMVDALGGISVYSQQSFWTTEYNDVSYYISEGYNDLSGIETLFFARERYNLWNGDYQRGENHEEIVKALIEKATSPAIITGAYEILESVSDNLDTNMTAEQIQELIKMQIDEEIDWEIISMSAEGTDGSDMCYSYAGGELSVVYPNEESVLELTEAIEAILNNEILFN